MKCAGKEVLDMPWTNGNILAGTRHGEIKLVIENAWAMSMLSHFTYSHKIIFSCILRL